MALGADAKPVTKYYISGIWKNLQDVSHYAVHINYDPGVSAARKMSRLRAINMVTTQGIEVYTFEWDYNQGLFVHGQRVKYDGRIFYTEPFSDKKKI
ncbi:hypothetical protein [Flavobacterium sp. 3HN19-14]|uniref:hypothetical protein n=1 Tax=Flavobacterium sp. 3HN19-14 TaxID=3448133 RepID=UPI003EDF2C24